MYVYIPAYQKTYDITIHLIASWPWTPTLKNETSPLSQVLCIAMYIGFAFFFAGFKDTTKSSLLEEHDDEVSFFLLWKRFVCCEFSNEVGSFQNKNWYKW